MKDVILTGVRSNDEPTLGNYLGAFVPMVRLQQEKAGEYQVNMFVPDLHSFTTPIEHTTLYERTLKNLKYFVAAGLDLDSADTYIYRQSFVPAHSELTWILDCFTSFGQMERMTQFKERSGVKDFEDRDAELEVKFHTLTNPIASIDHETGRLSIAVDDIVQSNSEMAAKLISLLVNGMELRDRRQKNMSSTGVGIFNYPVLMAADILLYGAKWVPVGDDQKQHLEFTRDIAQRMNNKFGEPFTVPEDWKKQLEFASLDSGVRVHSLTAPDKKMSKSVEDPRGTILLSDAPSDAAKKVMSATTDNVGAINFDWDNQPGVTNLLQILSLITGRAQADVTAEWTGQSSYGDLKKAVAEAVETFLTDFQAKVAAVDETKLLAKLEASETAMRTTANTTLLAVQQAVGLRPKV